MIAQPWLPLTPEMEAANGTLRHEPDTPPDQASQRQTKRTSLAEFARDLIAQRIRKGRGR